MQACLHILYRQATRSITSITNISPNPQRTLNNALLFIHTLKPKHINSSKHIINNSNIIWLFNLNLTLTLQLFLKAI